MSEFLLYGWEGYEDPNILGRFSETYQVSTSAEHLTSDAEAASRVIDGHTIQPSILNINNPFPKKWLFPEKRIRELDHEMFAAWDANLLPWTRPLCEWACSVTGELVGIPQRFGSFNFVINTKRVSRGIAEDEGFYLLDDPSSAPRYGVLVFPEFNVFHIALSAGLNPFQSLSLEEKERFQSQARQWFTHAACISDDSRKLNKRLVDQSIDVILSAGMFSSGYLRREGFKEIHCVTPRKGPIDGKGGICFLELNTIPVDAPSYTDSIRFLQMILRPDIALYAMSNHINCNPIVQMGDPEIFNKVGVTLLEALQWDTLEEDLSRCVEYDLPPDFDELLGIVKTVIKSVGVERWL